MKIDDEKKKIKSNRKGGKFTSYLLGKSVVFEIGVVGVLQVPYLANLVEQYIGVFIRVSPPIVFNPDLQRSCRSWDVLLNLGTMVRVGNLVCWAGERDEYNLWPLIIFCFL